MPATVKTARKGLRRRKTRPVALPDTIQTPAEPALGSSPVANTQYTPFGFDPLASHNQASHLERAIPRAKRDKTIADCIKALNGADFDTIAVRGISGLLIGPILAHIMKRELLVIRKTGEKTASPFEFEGHYGARRYIILDDLISSYSTAVHIVRGVKLCAPSAELVGILLYNTAADSFGPTGVEFQGPTEKYSHHFQRAKDYAADPTFHFVR